ncbi:O-antigen ligase family protein [Pseudidiomarina sp. GXY010]|uniref:O-antigen ligase family protein n=1 Tax=Pseudidiomarina fusca TaxID=2965078 RepID=A0ABU3KXS3_9GAMM|nr:O-antigen ligase family protein [Pseudidiomarina sp. GXY010]MDT7526308.1 O-antigen ligase family protein [Pseudidiomarina sp. GXY010]
MQNIAIAYVALWVTSPAMAYGTLFRALALLAVAGWFFLELLRPNNLLLRPSVPALIATVYIVYIAVIDYLQYGGAGLIQNFQLFIAFYFLYVIESRRNNVESLRPVFWWVLLTLPITYIKTIYTLWFVNGHAMRLAVRSGDTAMQIAQEGVGGYGLAYSTVIMVPALVMLFKYSNQMTIKWWQKLLIAANLVLAVTLVLSSGFTIAVLTLIATLGTLVILAKVTLARALLATFLAALLLIGYKPVLQTSLTAIQPLTQGTNYFIKIRDVLETLEQGEAQGTASDRIVRWERSAKIFLEHPILGVWSNRDIGKHSEILDTFARLGIFFGVIFVYLMIYIPIRYLGISMRTNGLVLASLVCMAAVTFMNNFVASQGMALFLFLPVSIALLTYNTMPRIKNIE